MTKSTMNLQDSFLNQVRKDNVEIKLVLLDGTVLSGHVRGFDNFTVILSARGAQHLIYKHAIAQIISHRMPRPESDREHGDGRGERAGGGDEAPAPAAPREGRSEAARAEAARAEEHARKQKFNSIDLTKIQVEGQHS